MVQIRLFAYKIAEIKKDGVKPNHFKAIEICENTAQLLAKMYNGKTDCSSCGVVQYSDTVHLEKLSQEDENFIKNIYPFVSVRRPLFGNQFFN